MFIRRRGRFVEVWAPAKINLTLEVHAAREDGFHEIVTLMTAVDIFDTLYFAADSKGSIELSCDWARAYGRRAGKQSPEIAGDDLGELPTETDNIVYRAVQLLRRRAGTESGAAIRLVKRIPAAAGLGGASSDAAAALVAANEGFQLGWPQGRLMELAAELGSDVPFFFGPGAAVCRGRGERIEPLPGLGKLDVVVVRPPGGLATREVYENCDPVDRGDRIALMVDALQSGNAAAVGRAMTNRLQEAAEGLSPWIGRLRGEVDRLGCPGHQMSGSGTSYFVICRHARHARRVAGVLQSRDIGRVYLARTVYGTNPCR